MRHDVWITGGEVFTAFGFGTAALRAGVFGGRPAFEPIKRFDTSPFRNHFAATYAGDGPGLPGADRDEQPLQLEAMLACVTGALGSAGLDPTADTAVVLGTQGDYTGVHHFWQAAAAGRTPSPSDTFRSLAGGIPDTVAATLGLGTPRLAFINACVASANAFIHACRLVANGVTSTAVTGGVYLVDEEQFAKFDSGRTFAEDGRLRAFAAGRSGMLLGDGATAMVLESADHARARGARPLARVAGYGMAADAHHVVQPHPRGKGLAAAITAALANARLDGSAIDYVNAHGTGTRINDPAETSAVRRAFGRHADRLPVSSTKTTTGHMLEATGAVELMICVLALRDQVLPPTASYDAPDPDCDLDYVVNHSRRAPLRRVLSINAGFGGLDTAIILERP